MGANIPLPALDIRPPQQQADPTENLLRLKSLLGQQQLQQGQQQLQQQQIQSNQMDIDSQKAWQKAYMEAQGDPDKTTKLAAQYGAKPGALLQWQNAVLDQKTKTLDLVLKQGAQAKIQADLVQGAHDTVSQAKPEDRAAVYQQQRQQLAAQGVDVSQITPQYPGDEAFKFQGIAVKSHAQQVDELVKQSEIGKNTAQGQDAAAGAQLKTNELNSGLAPGIPLDKLEASSWLQKNPGKTLADFMKARALMVPTANFNLQNSGAGPQANGQPSAMAQAVASGTMKWQDVISPRTPMSVKNQFAQEVKQINPNFDTSTFSIEQKAAEKATSGTWADTRLAYNTAIDHSSQLLKAIDALKGGDQRTLNSLKNFFSTEFGSPQVPTYDAIANAYNHEVTSVVSKGHITDAEVQTGHATLPANASPDQLRGVVGAYKSLMQSKAQELNKIIKAGAGNKADSILGVQAGDQPPPAKPTSANDPLGIR